MGCTSDIQLINTFNAKTLAPKHEYILLILTFLERSTPGKVTKFVANPLS